LRALLEDLPPRANVVVIIRASTVADIVHRAEVAALVEYRGGRLHELIGSRDKLRLNARALRQLVPDVADRDIYICGPAGFDAEVAAAAQRLGVADDQIHIEEFGF
jgi:ferredoxin-NADP reductase